jgi:hypothetical protein
MMCGLIECFAKRIGKNKGRLQEKYVQSWTGVPLKKYSLEKPFLAYNQYFSGISPFYLCINITIPLTKSIA